MCRLLGTLVPLTAAFRSTNIFPASHQQQHVFILMRLGLPERAMRQRVHQHMPTWLLDQLSLLSSFNTSAMASQDLPDTYHPTFNIPNADAVLSSLDGTLYGLPSSVLQRATTFFVSRSFAFEPNSNPIPIHEHDVVLEQLLRIISDLAILPWRTFDDLEATRFGWEEEAELASKHTLSLSLHEEQHQEALRRISTRLLVKLFKFHRKRRDIFFGGRRVCMDGAGVEAVLNSGRRWRLFQVKDVWDVCSWCMIGWRSWRVLGNVWLSCQIQCNGKFLVSIWWLRKLPVGPYKTNLAMRAPKLGCDSTIPTRGLSTKVVYSRHNV
ncbi:hypothetical protein F5146DRAFT_1125283 [Armillaria mellea]|nr:hypothetical protein F5146DRAFT_1125283 [Armillaria mellea]